MFSTQLKRDGLVAKILTWGMDPHNRLMYLSTTQNICPMFWRFVFKLVSIAVYYLFMTVAWLYLLSIMYSAVMNLMSLTFWSALQSVGHFVLICIASVVITGLALGLIYLVGDVLISFLPRRQKESESDLSKLTDSYREARRGKFCSPVTFT